MSGPARLAAFAGLLAAVFAASLLAGRAFDPAGPEVEAGHAEVASERDHADGDPATPAGAGVHGAEAGEGVGAPPGLQVAEGGLRLRLERSRMARASAPAPLELAIVDDDDRPVRDFELEHERRMHLIVAARDLGSFEHLHPRMRPGGSWVARADLSRAGDYRVFADFKREGRRSVLGADLQVGGVYEPRALPAPGARARAGDGITVSMRGGGGEGAGGGGRVAFEVRDRGRPVDHLLRPYLGARGHLVALRDGDLAYLHTHPEEDELAFAVEYPSAGAYRLFVQFRYRGEVRTAAFTREVAAP